MAKLLKVAVCIGILSVVVYQLVDFCKLMGVFRELVPIEPGNCHLIKGVEYGSEDINILPGGLALISTGLKYQSLPNFDSDRPGHILLVDLNESVLSAVKLRISRGFDVESFNPHGLSTYIDGDGTVYVFVVNHPRQITTVEIFTFDEDQNSLNHLKTIKHELLHSVNDIVALSPDSFYATNDHYFSHEHLKNLELVIGLSWCTVVYYSPSDVKEVATGLRLANGINVSPDRRYIYIAESLGHNVHVMEIAANNTLTPVKTVNVGTLPDNLEVDPKTGDVWIGCCPICWKLFLYNPENAPGSEVIRIENILSMDPKVTQVYVNNDSTLQGSSVATVYEEKLLIGTIFHKALYCELSAQP
ncbi:serum paraoxonase/arylesterase 2-like [Scyliorhinus canicula]|uniref:serum paraoxonase/arylesterase 2-like n=1 Tax=Scyliorhinus canicula TaxID=7830 RepID=UPI0018F3F8CB|nr:serum paraoxonase/arylesterase 2-like [Scyliorhinus canicula]